MTFTKITKIIPITQAAGAGEADKIAVKTASMFSLPRVLAKPVKRGKPELPSMRRKSRKGFPYAYAYSHAYSPFARPAFLPAFTRRSAAASRSPPFPPRLLTAVPQGSKIP
jgi:hypothetical protein